MRARGLLCFALVVLPVFVSASAGCFSAAKDDFDKYTDKTASFRESTVLDAAAIDSQAPTEAVTGLYFGACLSQLAAGRLDRVLRFYTETKFTPSATGGTLSLTLFPMKIGPNDAGPALPPASVSKGETIGGPFTATDTAVDAKGVFDAAFGSITVPGTANPISGREIIISGAHLPGRFAVEKFCTQLSGHVAQPVEIDLVGTSNTCLFFAVKEGDPLPALTREMFDPGCPL